MTYECPICYKRFPTRDARTIHMWNVHREKKTY